MPNRPDDLAQRHLAKIVESSDDAIVSKDLNGTIVSWNPAAERMFGYTAAEAIGRSIRMIIPPDRQAEEDMVLTEVRAGRAVSHFETMRCRKDGRHIPISLTVSPVLDDDGRVIGASKIARDISERARLLEIAEEQAAIAEQVTNVGTVIAASLDQRTVVHKVTDAALELTKAEIGAFFYNFLDRQSGESPRLYTISRSRMPVEQSLEPDALESFEQAFRTEGLVRVVDTGSAARAALPLAKGVPEELRQARSYLAVRVTSISGALIGGLFFGHSEAGRFTPQHEQLAVGMASWAAIALQNARLYANAREADRLKDEFLAVLSHELRTPLSAILGYTRLLRGGVLTGEKADRGLEVLERNARALTQIVEDVLDVSRIITGKVRLDVQPVELTVVVHNAVATVQPAADSKSVRLQTIVDPRVGAVSGDPDRLQQVVWNLLSNAVKFTPKHGRVQVRVERVNSHIELTVSDTGIGIAPSFLPHVFERFRQADAGTTRKTGGLGLGLSIVRHIVELHGGTIDASSAGEGQGATFRVKLPLMIVQPDLQHERRDHPRSETQGPLTNLADLTGVRVLAIDDEPDALNLLRAALEAAGAHVVTRASAVGVVDEIAGIGPDALVVDLGMPAMDGFTFIAAVRATSDPRVAEVPAAALTAFARSEDRTRALRTGFEMHLAKPIDPGELVAAVATLVRRRRKNR